MTQPRRDRRRGGSVIEVALLLPWYIFLFVGAFDWGYYAQALIATENAARVAALYTSQNASTAAPVQAQAAACRLARAELWYSSNIGGAGITTCNALPLIVTAVDAGPGQTVASADGAPATQVTVTYQTARLIPIPGVLTNRATFTRVVQMRVREGSS